MNQKLQGHLFALFTVFVWGVTFVSTKILLDYYTPLAIMVMRFSLAYIGLWLIHPKVYKVTHWKEELNYVIAGLTGVSAYFVIENSSLLYTTVSNTGLILASAPLFVAIITHLFSKDEHFSMNIVYGFLLAMIGVSLVVFNGQVSLQVNPFGDFLAISAAVVWAVYSLTIKKMKSHYSPLFLTRRTFFYGIVTGLLFLFTLEGGFDPKPLFSEGVWGHIGFLGLIASGTCYVLWNHAIRRIGAVKTSNYIYLMPLFTMAASTIVLHEAVTELMLVGCGFILSGVYVAERGFKGLTFPRRVYEKSRTYRRRRRI